MKPRISSKRFGPPPTRCSRSSTTSSIFRRSNPADSTWKTSRSIWCGVSKTPSTFSSVRAAEKKLELAAAVDPTLPRWIRGDVTRLRQILVNLLGNAVKFTAEGEVTLTVKRFAGDADTPSLHFAVRDSGCGIPADRLHRLFRAFSQVDASTTRIYGGTGLGLVISKKLAEIMGGRIWVETEDGKGSVFQFIIPLKAAPDQETLRR